MLGRRTWKMNMGDLAMVDLKVAKFEQGKIGSGKKVKFRLGIVSVDYVIGFVIMLVIVGVFISFVVWISQPGGPFQVAIREIALRGAQDIETESSWTLTKMPIVIESAGTTLPMETGFVPTANTDFNSIVVTDANSNPILSEYDNSTNQVAWVASLSAGRNLFYLVHAEGTRLRPMNWTQLAPASFVTVENVTGGWRLGTQRLNVSFGPAGVYDLLLDGLRPITATGQVSIDLGPNAGLETPRIRGGAARQVLSFANGITAKVFTNENKIWVQAPASNPIPSVTIRTPVSMTRYYTSASGDQAISGSTPGYLVLEQLNHVLDVYDPNGDIGLAIVGNRRPVNVSLYDNVNDYRAIVVNNATDFFILPHRGNFAFAEAEAHLSSNPPNVTIGAPVITQGISRQRFQITGAQALLDYEAFKRTHALLGFDYNVTIEEIRR